MLRFNYGMKQTRKTERKNERKNRKNNNKPDVMALTHVHTEIKTLLLPWRRQQLNALSNGNVDWGNEQNIYFMIGGLESSRRDWERDRMNLNLYWILNSQELSVEIEHENEILNNIHNCFTSTSTCSLNWIHFALEHWTTNINK